MIETDVEGLRAGGPLFNDRGEFVGVVTRMYDGQEGPNLAIPVDYVRGLLLLDTQLTLAELREKVGEVPREQLDRKRRQVVKGQVTATGSTGVAEASPHRAWQPQDETRKPVLAAPQSTAR